MKVIKKGNKECSAGRAVPLVEIFHGSDVEATIDHNSASRYPRSL
jgi:hypothetical protein